MGAFKGLTSGLRGMLWLVRSGGLREQMRRLEAVGARVQALEERLAQAGIATNDAPNSTEVRHASAADRWLPAGDLRAYERRVFSQNGEDGILQEILQRIGTTNRYFVEFGVESGIECNCALLAREKGWHGLFLEPEETYFKQLVERYRSFQRVKCVRAIVTAGNIESLLAASAVPSDLDVLSIDVDGNDYWIWAAIQRWQPRIVIIEYNASYPPPKKWVMREDTNYRWNGTNYHGASLASLTALGKKKGYQLVATNSTGINAFFVREELCTPGRFLDPSLQYHYSPPAFGPFHGGHPPGSGPFEEI